ncbi:prolyl oligopeptidase family serine peptidase [bacterium]|nr:prolyl oligopeptidase family serine peptidase [bacterium]
MNENSPIEVLIDPNKWDKEESLMGTVFSRDGKYLAFGKTKGGDESPVVSVMEVETRKVLPDKLKGWKQFVSVWLPDNSGFYYTAKPLKGEVPEGEENYWHSVYFHKLGTTPEEDVKVFYHDKVKEYFHGVTISEDGKYEIFYRSMFNKNEIYYQKTGSSDPLIPLVTGFDAQYGVEFIEGKILIRTDSDAPHYKVMITDVDKPEKENWKVFIPEDKKDTLENVSGVAGHVYVEYTHNAYSHVKIYSLKGEYLRELKFPTVGTGGVIGYWTKQNVWVWFSSFTYPSTTFKYDFANDKLDIYKVFPVKIDVDNFMTEQIWYKSKDGTPISMFLVRRKNFEKNGSNPVLLSGYGGFNVPMEPHFTTSYVVWLESGGMIAIPNLRGGGEYGKDWHEAGMKEKKQNVFDDFIAAAEWLIENKYTNPQKLAISGGSNGGLLMGAVVTQRPDLFKACLCAVPLLDMIRYHKVGIANIWKEEYGSAEDPEQFKYILKYSPYHNVKNGTKYPAMLIVGSENDARVDPMHARKFAARLQAAQGGEAPIMLLILKASGHGGGTTLSIQIEQQADDWGFLMNELGMKGKP